MIDQAALQDAIESQTAIRPDDADALDSFAEINLSPFGDDPYDTRFEPDDTLSLTLRLIVWARYDGAHMIRDIKEQPVRIHPRLLTDAARFAAWLDAHRAVWVSALSNVSRVEYCLPADLIFPGALALKRPQTVEQFVSALQVRSRLGRLL